MGVEISAGRLDVGIEYLQTMELIRFVLCRPTSANQLALRELCVTAHVEICKPFQVLKVNGVQIWSTNNI